MSQKMGPHRFGNLLTIRTGEYHMVVRKPQVIAEIGQAHDGSLGILHSMVDAVASAGAHTVKFQMHIADAESSPEDQFRIHFSRVDATRYDYWRRMELTLDQWREVKQHCEEAGCEFLCTPFSMRAVEMLEALNVARYKVGSGDTINDLLLDGLGQTGKPVIISSGMSTFKELDHAVEILRGHHSDIAVMQCTSEYPVPPKRWGLNLIPELASRYNLPVGLSDHSGKVFPGLAAVALGAKLVEVHITFDKQMFGPDTPASLDMRELSELVNGVAQLGEALANPQNENNADNAATMRNLFGRTLTVARDIAKGTPIAFEDLEAAKPAGCGIPPSSYRYILGKSLKRDLAKGEFILEEDVG